MARCIRLLFAAATCCGLLLILSVPRLQLLSSCYLFSVEHCSYVTTVSLPSRRVINRTTRRSVLGNGEQVKTVNEACTGCELYGELNSSGVYKTNIETEPEILRINSRLDRCLQVSNLSQLFQERGLDIVAKQNARELYSTLRSVVPPSFDAAYAYSPCWNASYKVAMQESGRVVLSLGNLTFESDINEYREALKVSLLKDYHGQYESSILCLPKVFLAGFPKSGSTYLYDVMTKGLGIPIGQAEKEPHWLIQKVHSKFSQKPKPLQMATYFFNFAKANHWAGLPPPHKDFPLITIDGTPTLFHLWPRYLDQEQIVNYCLVPAIVPEILPESKYVVVMRNPIKMLYSAFWYACTYEYAPMSYAVQIQSPTTFHERMEMKLNQFHECSMNFSLEWCVANASYIEKFPKLPCAQVQLAIAFYYVHIHKWLALVPQERFIFLTLEELLENPNEVAKNIWQFLGIPGDFKGLQQFVADTNEQTTIKYQSDPHLHMREDTEKRLKEFFRPYNQMLADLLSDKRFLWEEQP